MRFYKTEYEIGQLEIAEMKNYREVVKDKVDEKSEVVEIEVQTEDGNEVNEEIEVVKAERDRLLGDNNYLKKKLQSVVLENEKMMRTL